MGAKRGKRARDEQPLEEEEVPQMPPPGSFIEKPEEKEDPAALLYVPDDPRFSGDVLYYLNVDFPIKTVQC